ncbi:MAG: sigma-54-dependent Fis family transcriptional regulator [Deltaproteobacteria bacterium]|nr:sigma-54-dependent Fis family transcriptional regulator [Deltaproteobacteria bacterium]
MSKDKILIADDEKSMRELLDIMLKKEGYKITLASNGEEVIKLIEKDIFDLALVDIRMPRQDGISVLKKIKTVSPETIVIMMTAFASADTAIKAMKEGAYDYITKPFKIDEIKIIIQNALEKKHLEKENFLLKQVVRDRYHFENIIGQSSKMLELYDLLEKVAPTKTNILITGESGTGKELVAKAIHYNSPRKDKPFVTLNCGAIPESLIESELFGHMRGAFTDAITTKKGLFEVADEGTLFLDEISELPLMMQVKLLRVLQDREFKRVGGTEDIRVDVRIISATNKDLEGAVREKQFREDLFYRLNVIQIKLPTLRERKEDIPSLVNHFLNRYAEELGKQISQVSSEALRILVQYDYPGNVRELQNIIERAVALETSQELTAANLNSYLEEQSLNLNKRRGFDLEIPTEGVDLEKIVEDIERTLLIKALDRTKGIKKKAAELLHINFRSMRYRLEKYGLNHEDEP